MNRRLRTVAAHPTRLGRIVLLSGIGIVFAIPIVSMLEFTFRVGGPGSYGLDHWLAIIDPENERRYRTLFQGILNSLILAGATVTIVLVLLVPTMILVQLRVPRLQRVLEFVCIVPITVPAIVLVVGLAPVYSVVTGIFGSSAWTLAFAYGITVLPYAYRAIYANLQTVDIVTLSEAARSLSAGWATVVLRVIVPNLKRGLLAASFISVAVVLGEFTIASLLNRNNLQTSLVQVSKSDPYAAVIFSLLSLAFASVLLIIIGRVGTAKRGKKES
ncbi:ABC transporter permease [Lysinibacter cavernae]|uniref:Putative spermidine/putrescine transport system permease protein n=1 Tax=Lysinibacter cavernae TaxID=1640652 RepID=A0A7X5R4K6_9MICO|nr:ABC transporter permease subunit [Lysinibacter cavernae]NIH55205.1 putative spermidine/putrescine transport system permease protein [Lysinibacter cavernae]